MTDDSGQYAKQLHAGASFAVDLVGPVLTKIVGPHLTAKLESTLRTVADTAYVGLLADHLPLAHGSLSAGLFEENERASAASGARTPASLYVANTPRVFAKGMPAGPNRSAIVLSRGALARFDTQDWGFVLGREYGLLRTRSFAIQHLAAHPGILTALLGTLPGIGPSTAKLEQLRLAYQSRVVHLIGDRAGALVSPEGRDPRVTLLNALGATGADKGRTLEAGRHLRDEIAKMTESPGLRLSLLLSQTGQNLLAAEQPWPAIRVLELHEWLEAGREPTSGGDYGLGGAVPDDPFETLATAAEELAIETFGRAKESLRGLRRRLAWERVED